MAAHPLPGEPVPLAAAPQRPEPQAPHLVKEGRWCIVAGPGVVGEVASQHTRQPPSLLRDGCMPAPPQLVVDLPQLGPHPFRLALTPPRTAPAARSHRCA